MSNDNIVKENICFFSCVIISIIISTIITLSLGITTVCEYKSCGWDKDICILNNPQIYEKENYMYELSGNYEIDIINWCYNEKFLLIKRSDNKTYLEYLKENVYYDQSPQECWFRNFNCDIKNKYPYNEEKMYKLAYSTLFFGIFIFFLIFICQCHLRVLIFRYKNLNENSPIIPSAPPSYDSVN